MSYEYSAQNRLELPHKYMYTQYGGKDFLQEYFLSRKGALETIKEKLKSNPMTQSYDFLNYTTAELLSVKFTIPFSQVDLGTIIKTNFLTKDLMMALVPKINNEEQLPRAYELLSIFNKKFEVAKKIFDSYTPEFKKNGEEGKNTLNYSLLSFNLLLYHGKHRNLKFLNCALKLNDLLCSVAEKIPSEELLLVERVLEMEKELIIKLMAQQGVDQ